MATKQGTEPTSEKDLQRVDEATVQIVAGINHLLMSAQREGLTTITAILKDARESIARWAAYDNYNESKAERLYHHMTSDHGFHDALSFLTKFSMIIESTIKDDLLQTMEKFQFKNALPLKSKEVL